MKSQPVLDTLERASEISRISKPVNDRSPYRNLQYSNRQSMRQRQDFLSDSDRDEFLFERKQEPLP